MWVNETLCCGDARTLSLRTLDSTSTKASVLQQAPANLKGAQELRRFSEESWLPPQRADFPQSGAMLRRRKACSSLPTWTGTVSSRSAVPIGCGIKDGGDLNTTGCTNKSNGFACKQTSSKGQDFDVVIDGDAKAFTERKYPKGIMQLNIMDKRTVRITFDPAIVGQELLWETCLGLNCNSLLPSSLSRANVTSHLDGLYGLHHRLRFSSDKPSTADRGVPGDQHLPCYPGHGGAANGIIVTGATEVDMSILTGESLPVEKHPGSAVIAGSINGFGVTVVCLTNHPGHNTISTVAAMTGAWQSITAITYGVSVLIVSCPCAIGLYIPMVTAVAGGAATNHGVIFKSALALDSAPRVSHEVFVKTGTLTEGELSVIEEVILADKQLARSVTLGLARNSNHPVSAAISSYLRAEFGHAAEIRDVRSITGKGVEGTYAGGLTRCGNTRWLSLHELPEVQVLVHIGLTVFGVTINDKPEAVFGLSDSIRSETRSVLAELKKRKIAVSIVSGDDAGATETLASKLEIPPSNVR
ncbi:hypothetical protein BAUCODRAFT_130579 [Baudoinia panamericana UAMH 10762]|uniref:HMA domain-containing protein n=1 Tax=Baudoinia panamericana (strain UAMH 10762) TaxID=717646 RepID=M2NDZ3_BAUPA|nr:uncharacterized protein BAUCODRAFT_130579 [Baudoinia panamericana UAMH 10762]EMC97434.1 hypothetical protein BAUCODRAFT_130579 [Baudoinia panamericana UAMH 10762]